MIVQSRKMKGITTALFSLCVTALLLCFFAPTAHAEAKKYDVEFKAGADGTIDGATSITQEITYGGSVDAAAVEKNVKPNSGYYFTGWNKEVEPTVTKKATYVAKYARVINEATYRVRYLDTFGNELATQQIIPASIGGNVTVTAPVIPGYNVDALAKATTVSEKGTEIIFVYTPSDNPAFPTLPGITTVPGTPGTTGTTAAIPGIATPTDNPINTTDPTNPANPNETVDNNQTPLAPGETENIDPNQTPLANMANQVGGMGNLLMIGGGVLALLAIIITAIIVKRKKRANS